jgi:2,5-diketo-D-gluconate reductase A
MGKLNSKIVFILLLLIFSVTLIIASNKSKSLEVEIPNVVLNNGVKMPILGFGTMDIRNANDIAKAIELGYRLFDTATIYRNEEVVGQGIKQSGIDRAELFITTKLWVDDSGYESTKRTFQTSLDKLGLDYIDLYLIHRPRGNDVQGSWRAMEELYEAGKIKAIGVSNFELHQLAELMANARIMPMVNQIEAHPLFQQYEAQVELESLGIQMQGWSPFIGGRGDILSNPTLITIGEQYNKTAAQVILRWLFQRGIISIPRTNNHAYMAENLDIFNFELTASDIEKIKALDLNTTQFPDWN